MNKNFTFPAGSIVAMLLTCLIVWLSGCTTTKYVDLPLPAVPCGKTLAPAQFETCAGPVRLPEGTTFNQLLEDDAYLRKALKDCSIKAKVLQDTILACQKVQ